MVGLIMRDLPAKIQRAAAG